MRFAGGGLSAVPLGVLDDLQRLFPLAERQGAPSLQNTVGETTMKCQSIAKGGILVIDDDSAILADLTRILSVGGYTCHCCRDLATAVEQYRETTPRLVIADLAIVGPNGYRLNQAIYPDMGHISVPLMFLSSGQHPDIIHRHGDNGGAYYLRKPIEVVVLLELVDKALWNRKLAAAALAT